MKTWWVLGWDTYYPEGDNFINSFEFEYEAIAFANSLMALERYERSDHYRIIDVSDRL